MSGKTESQIRNQLIGTWKLVSTEETLKDGTTRPFPQFGPSGKGFLMYQADGYMCVVLLNPDRQRRAGALHPTLEEKAAAADCTFTYCGRYEIDMERQHILHFPEIATDPNFVGSRQIRPFRFQGNHLIFSDIERESPEVASWKIVWEKVRK